MNYTNVLIVEDEAVIAADVRFMVEDLGFKALGIASSGEESLRKAEALRPDLVLMDIKIKGDMDGVSAAGEIFRRFRIPVVYMTAYSDPQTIKRVNRPGTLGWLIKPLEPSELENILCGSAVSLLM
jgi:AmiR/NasT family two-component response regulator